MSREVLGGFQNKRPKNKEHDNILVKTPRFVVQSCEVQVLHRATKLIQYRKIINLSTISFQDAAQTKN